MNIFRNPIIIFGLLCVPVVMASMRENAGARVAALPGNISFLSNGPASHAGLNIPDKPDPAILLNQLGFYNHAEKIAIVRGLKAPALFSIVNTVSKDTVLRGTLVSDLSDTLTKTDPISRADFSSLAITGTYRLVAGVRENPPALISHEFRIGNNIHHQLAAASIKGFYYQRSSGELTGEFAGMWARPAGHPDTSVLVHASAAGPRRPAGTVINSTGGWYDAGDYNKYIVNSGITMGTLMSAYEDYQTWFDTLRLNIPESANRQSDLLDEVEYNLRWMLTMQDPDDGGVYHKCTNAAFDGNVMPGVTKLPRYVVQKSTAAALDFAAVMAQAARVFANSNTANKTTDANNRDHSKLDRSNKSTPDGSKKSTPDGSKKPKLAASKKVKPDASKDDLPAICLAAAKKAWSWALANPAMLYNQDSINKIYQPAITTGAYGDRSLSDEWFWAASELYITTGDPGFASGLNEKPDLPVTLPGWPSVRTMGIYSIIRHKQKINTFKNPLKPAVVGQYESQVVQLANEYLALRVNNPFFTVMGSRKSEFNWGSNSNAANQGILLINAWKITGNRKMLHAALSNLDYLCGRNATGYCFVTGFGTVSPMHPHHRPSVADKVDAPVPGLLAGGPNSGMQDKCSYRFTEPALAYTDDFCSYASNEIAINWNAPLVYLANALEAISATTNLTK